MNETFIIAGLGNPGSKYDNTRHNVGFIVLDALAQGLGFTFGAEKWQAHARKVTLWGAQIVFLKPTTFMNLSGQAVSRYADFYKVPVDHILVIHDDLDMCSGRVKLVKGGGAGGHNGIRSLVQCLGGNDFFRLKIGIGRPGQSDTHPSMPVEKYVLASLSSDESKILKNRIHSIEQGLEYLISDGSAKAKNLLNSLK